MKRILLTVIFIVAMVLPVFTVPVHAETSQAVVPVRIAGTPGGTVKIEPISPTVADANCKQVSVPATGTDITFVHDYAGNHPYDTYDYKISQVPGTDPHVEYDETEYTVRVYVGYASLDSTERASTVVIRKDGEDYKPAEIDFVNIPASEDIEERTLTRTITYTEYTADGKEVSVNCVQTIKIQRTVRRNSHGTIVSYGPWEYVSGDRSAVKSPTRKGWTANIKEVPVWEFDPDNPQDEVIHVIYKPNPIDKIIHRILPKTGDGFRLMLFAGVGLASSLMLFLTRKKRPNQKRNHS